MSEEEDPGGGGGVPGRPGGSGPARGGRRIATASREKQEWIGRQLRSVYNQVLDEPLPEQLKDLLTRLDTKRKGDA